MGVADSGFVLEIFRPSCCGGVLVGLVSGVLKKIKNPDAVLVLLVLLICCWVFLRFKASRPVV